MDACLRPLRLMVGRNSRVSTLNNCWPSTGYASISGQQQSQGLARPRTPVWFHANTVSHHLLGNTQATQHPRQNTHATDPRRHAVWTLPRLAERVQQWADEEYDTLRHPALGMTPREAYDLSMKQDGERAHKYIEYDDTFLKATFPLLAKGRPRLSLESVCA